METLESVDLQSPTTIGVDEVRRVARERFGITSSASRAGARHHVGPGRARTRCSSCRRAAASRSATSSRRCCCRRPTVVVSPLLALLEDQYLKMQQLGVPDGASRQHGRRRRSPRRAGAHREGRPAAHPDHAGDARRQRARAAARDRARPGWSPSTRRTASRSGATTSVRRIWRSASACSSSQTGRILGLTATATPHVREDIVRYLALRDPEIIVSSPHRHNLVFEVRRAGRRREAPPARQAGAPPAAARASSTARRRRRSTTCGSACA